MRTGALVKIKGKYGFKLEKLGGHRIFEGVRCWWLTFDVLEVKTNDVFLLVKKNPELYCNDLKFLNKNNMRYEKNYSVIYLDRLKTFFVTKINNLETISEFE